MGKTFLTNSYKETQKLAKDIAKNLDFNVIGLRGDLGGGKTTFTQGFAQALGVKDKILSPTFVILKKFKKTKGYLYHIDCYRLNNGKELLELGFDDIIKDKDNIVVLEWADLVDDILPKETIFIDFEFINENKRKIWIQKN
jgi:tRNA threonylcarbamoyladenosine biosynthesis protein TsaE